MFFYKIKMYILSVHFHLSLSTISILFHIYTIYRFRKVVTYMLQKENLSDIIRLLAGFLLSLKLLFNSFGINFITNDQIDAIVNVVSFLFILYFGYKNNYVGKKESSKRKYSKAQSSLKRNLSYRFLFIIVAPQLHLFAVDHMILRYIEMYM